MIVEIKGHQYRYSYNPDTGKTDYLGPVGDGPALTEEEFNRVIIPRKQEDEFVTTAAVKEVVEVVTLGDVGLVTFITHSGERITLNDQDVQGKVAWKKLLSLKPGDVIKFTGDPIGPVNVEVLKTKKKSETERERTERELEETIRKQQTEQRHQIHEE